MRTYEVRELEIHLSDILREAREEGEEVTVTDNGAVVARLVPEPPADAVAQAREWIRNRQRPTPEELAAAWARIARTAEEIGKYVTEPTNAVEVVRDVRRDL